MAHNHNDRHRGPNAPRTPLRAPESQAHIARIPKVVIKRLSLYSRILQNLEMSNIEKVSSRELAEHLGLTSAQVRKDLAYFGQFGVPGFGYHVSDLRANLKRILRTDREVHVALIGVGNLGLALMSYGGFSRHGFKITLAFDVDRRRIGTFRNNTEIYDVAQLESRIDQKGIDIAILAVPARAAQAIADRLVGCGIIAILNFVPQRLIVPPNVKVHYVDLAIEIESLSYYLG